MSSVLDGAVLWAVWEKLSMFQKWEAMFAPVKKFSVAPCALYGVVGSAEEEPRVGVGDRCLWHCGERSEIRERFNPFIVISVSSDCLVGGS